MLATFAAVQAQPDQEVGDKEVDKEGGKDAIAVESDAPSDIASDIPSFAPTTLDERGISGSAGSRQCVAPLLGAFTVAAGAFFMQN